MKPLNLIRIITNPTIPILLPIIPILLPAFPILIPTDPNPIPNLSDPVVSAPTRSMTLSITPCDQCRVKKVSLLEIISIITVTRTCPSCGCNPHVAYQCKTVFNDGRSRVCPKGCKHNGYPLHHPACKHSDRAPSCTVTVNKFDAKRSIPLVETVNIGSVPIGIHMIQVVK